MSHRSSAKILICLLIAIGVLWSLQSAPACAQDRLSESQWKRGYHGFNMICEGIGLEPVDLVQLRSTRPKELVVVVFGNLQRIPFNVDWLVDNGAAVLIASDCSNGASFRFEQAGIRFRPANQYTTRYVDTFAGMPDCPVVSDIRPHPMTDGVNEIATNRPGGLTSSLRSRVAYLPTSSGGEGSNAFIAATENAGGGRMVAVADQSVFTNQMIVYRDNALFTDQAIKWLKNGDRKYMLVISDGMPYEALDPSDVSLHMPAPSRDEVLDALKNLPPSAMLDFANSVATVVEDDGMVNDFIHDNLKKIPDEKINRFLIFMMFAFICFSFVAGFLWQKKLLRQTASELAAQRTKRETKQRKFTQARERQWAAHVLLDTLCFDFAQRRYNDWPSFPIGLNLGDDRESKSVFKAMTKCSNLFKSKQSSYWTRGRLKQLDRDVMRWRDHLKQFADSNPVVDATEIAGSSAVVVDATIASKI